MNPQKHLKMQHRELFRDNYKEQDVSDRSQAFGIMKLSGSRLRRLKGKNEARGKERDGRGRQLPQSACAAKQRVGGGWVGVDEFGRGEIKI